MKPSGKYAKLNQSEVETLPTSQPEDGGILSERDDRWVYINAYILLVIFAAVACGILGYVVGQQNAPSASVAVEAATPRSELHCGNSSTEARDIGCVFDLLTNNWMPKSCSDSTTDSEYRAWVLDPARSLGAWAFYHDKKAEHQVPSEEHLANMVGNHVYTTTENHLAHCAFLARRMHRLVTGEIAAVAHNTLAHTMHCTSAILKAVGSPEPPVREKISSTFDVGIVSCLV